VGKRVIERKQQAVLEISAQACLKTFVSAIAFVAAPTDLAELRKGALARRGIDDVDVRARE